jgi:hypothetical protein
LRSALAEESELFASELAALKEVQKVKRNPVHISDTQRQTIAHKTRHFHLQRDERGLIAERKKLEDREAALAQQKRDARQALVDAEQSLTVALLATEDQRQQMSELHRQVQQLDAATARVRERGHCEIDAATASWQEAAARAEADVEDMRLHALSSARDLDEERAALQAFTAELAEMERKSPRHRVDADAQIDATADTVLLWDRTAEADLTEWALDHDGRSGPSRYSSSFCTPSLVSRQCSHVVSRQSSLVEPDPSAYPALTVPATSAGYHPAALARPAASLPSPALIGRSPPSVSVLGPRLRAVTRSASAPTLVRPTTPLTPLGSGSSPAPWAYFFPL